MPTAADTRTALPSRVSSPLGSIELMEDCCRSSSRHLTKQTRLRECGRQWSAADSGPELMAYPNLLDFARIPTEVLVALDWRPYHFAIQPYHYLIRITHIVSMAAFFGGIATLDLRLLGWRRALPLGSFIEQIVVISDVRHRLHQRLCALLLRSGTCRQSRLFHAQTYPDGARHC